MFTFSFLNALFLFALSFDYLNDKRLQAKSQALMIYIIVFIKYNLYIDIHFQKWYTYILGEFFNAGYPFSVILCHTFTL